MKQTIAKGQIILNCLVLLLIGLSAGQTNAQSNGQHLDLLSYSFGVIRGQTGRITITLRRLANPRSPDDTVSAVVQLLDTEGEVIAQSGELRLRTGQTRFWDQPRDTLPASTEPGGRLQLRVRVLVTTQSGDLDRTSVMPTIEVIDTITGGTVYQAGKRFLIFVSGPQGSKPDGR